MKRILKLTESDLVRVIKRIINEQSDPDFSANEFDKKKEEFTQEDYLNWKEYSRKKSKYRNYIPTDEERKGFNKYTKLRRLGQDPIAAFRGKEEEPFTQEDYLNWRKYSRKKSKDRNYIPTDEERKGFNKYFKLRRLGQDPIAAFRVGKEEEEVFTETDYQYWKQYKNKSRKNLTPTDEERKANNKYNKLRKKGKDPIAAYRGKGKEIEEEPFTMEEYLTLREYTRKIQKYRKYTPTEEEREAKNKYTRQSRKGLDPFAPFRKQEDPHIMEKNIKLTKTDLRLLIERIINERKQVGVLYHNTLMERLFKIIQENRLKVNRDHISSIINYRSKRDDNIMYPFYGPVLIDPSKIPPSISFTRNKQYKRYDDEAVIVLDGDKLSERYGITPYSNFGGRKYDEMEERVFRDVVNLDKYIIKIILPYESNRMESLLIDRGIPYEIRVK